MFSRFISKKKSDPQPKRPLFSVVIISYNMAREIPRTVQSFLPPYQTDISYEDVEIIVMENGSPRPVNPDVIATWPKNVRYINIDAPHPSPARALNQGVKLSRGRYVCPVIDGARMVTPGVLSAAREAAQIHDTPFIATIGYHLGDKVQQENVAFGYNQEVEDNLLASITWPETPYRLFDISSAGGSARETWFAPIAESNTPIMTRDFYDTLGGFDEGFDIPGGGLVNLDFFKRAVEHPNSRYILLIGEGSFHQYHGGVTTSRSINEISLEDATKTTWDIYTEQYEALRGETFKVSTRRPRLYGELRPEALRQSLKSAVYVADILGINTTPRT